MKTKISIITINYNNASGLQKTIESVVNQDFSQIEYIIIDGNSTDNSFAVIKSYESNIYFWVSEPDLGIYNAMNKGIEKANGDYLLFLNSGDILNDNNTISNSINDFNDSDLVVFDALLKIPDQKEFRHTHPKELNFSFLYNHTFAHQSVFIKKQLFNKVGYYDESLKIVSDWKFFIDAVVRYRASYKRIPEVLSYCVLDGVSATAQGTNLRNKERRYVLDNEYAGFKRDYEQLALLNLNRFKILKELETSIISKKLNSFLLRLQLFLFKGKRLKDLNDE